MTNISNRILITGSNGLLGQKIALQCLKNNIDFIATSLGENRNTNISPEQYTEMNICDPNQISTVLDLFKPTHVIHTAAITNVDYCELNAEKCQQTNVFASSYIWDACQERNIHFQFLSTDFVFDGISGNYSELDKVNPLSIYAKSKVDSENNLIQSSNKNWSIVRTIIVYGQGINLSRSNVICWAKEALSKEQEMRIVDDQYRAPTWADDLAWACLRICELNKQGIYHISGPETMSIFEIVSRVAEHFDLSTKSLTKTSSKALSQPAKRPPKTGFNLNKSKNELGYNPKTLEETLDLLI
ncbi:MAG: NAD(P)-dependent oxidoreductase [Crocinitomicaceae bacterium]|nr:NAD(P)-dependent oxidoreductase [Crocinitomicaceae bacterium]